MNFRTDLALERRELLTDREIPGVKSRVNQSGSVCVTAIEVQTEQGAQAIGKPVGSYITVEVPPFPLMQSCWMAGSAPLRMNYAPCCQRRGLY